MPDGRDMLPHQKASQSISKFQYIGLFEAKRALWLSARILQILYWIIETQFRFHNRKTTKNIDRRIEIEEYRIVGRYL